VTWTLEPDKKRYRETPFLTPEELAAMRARMQANLEKMRSCPVSQKQQQAQPVDQSKCQMSPPKIEVQKTADKLSIAGHDTQRTSATLTETCTDKDSGDVCDTVVAVDVWLTQETLPGSSDRRAFDLAYAKKLGLEDPQSFITADVAKYLAPYQSQIKLLQEKSAAFKGQPLKTSLRVLMGGPQCSAINKSTSDTNADNSNNGTANPLNNVAQAGKALGGLVGGLFHKKKADDSQSDSPPADAAPAGVPNAAASTCPRIGPRKYRSPENLTMNSLAPRLERLRVASRRHRRRRLRRLDRGPRSCRSGCAHHGARPAKPSFVSAAAVPSGYRGARHLRDRVAHQASAAQA
jgi:hypothetical protein